MWRQNVSVSRGKVDMDRSRSRTFRRNPGRIQSNTNSAAAAAHPSVSHGPSDSVDHYVRLNEGSGENVLSLSSGESLPSSVNPELGPYTQVDAMSSSSGPSPVLNANLMAREGFAPLKSPGGALPESHDMMNANASSGDNYGSMDPYALTLAHHTYGVQENSWNYPFCNGGSGGHLHVSTDDMPQYFHEPFKSEVQEMSPDARSFAFSASESALLPEAFDCEPEGVRSQNSSDSHGEKQDIHEPVTINTARQTSSRQGSSRSTGECHDCNTVAETGSIDRESETQGTSSRLGQDYAAPSPSSGHQESSVSYVEDDAGQGRKSELYDAEPHADGLYHCAYEGQEDCKHEPTKLKCNYDKHIDSHLKPYKCIHSECDPLRFSSTACRLRHEREAHGSHGHGLKPFLCIYPNCERAQEGNGFPRSWNCNDHMRRCHNHVVAATTSDTGVSPKSNPGVAVAAAPSSSSAVAQVRKQPSRKRTAPESSRPEPEKRRRPEAPTTRSCTQAPSTVPSEATVAAWNRAARREALHHTWHQLQHQFQHHCQHLRGPSDEDALTHLQQDLVNLVAISRHIRFIVE